MAGFWPDAGWAPWDALAAAGFRCVSDRRSVAPPVVLMEIDEESFHGPVGGCVLVEGVVLARCVGPPPDSADARRWAWTGPVQVLLPHSDGSALAVSDFEGLPCVEARLPFTWQEAVG